MCPDCNCSFLGSEKFERHIELKHGKEGFEDISKNSKSKVWLHFLLDRKNSKAKCLTCSFMFNVSHGSTKDLHNHLKTKHSIIVPKMNKK